VLDSGSHPVSLARAGARLTIFRVCRGYPGALSGFHLDYNLATFNVIEGLIRARFHQHPALKVYGSSIARYLLEQFGQEVSP